VPREGVGKNTEKSYYACLYKNIAEHNKKKNPCSLERQRKKKKLKVQTTQVCSIRMASAILILMSIQVPSVIE
jgi:hypothetical protein